MLQPERRAQSAVPVSLWWHGLSFAYPERVAGHPVSGEGPGICATPWSVVLLPALLVAAAHGADAVVGADEGVTHRRSLRSVSVAFIEEVFVVRVHRCLVNVVPPDVVEALTALPVDEPEPPAVLDPPVAGWAARGRVGLGRGSHRLLPQLAQANLAAYLQCSSAALLTAPLAAPRRGLVGRVPSILLPQARFCEQQLIQ
jgi:hypothetical protein